MSPHHIPTLTTWKDSQGEQWSYDPEGTKDSPLISYAVDRCREQGVAACFLQRMPIPRSRSIPLKVKHLVPILQSQSIQPPEEWVDALVTPPGNLEPVY